MKKRRYSYESNPVGKQFGRWVVMRPYPSAQVEDHWVCKCKCGLEQAFSLESLKTGVAELTECWCEQCGKESDKEPKCKFSIKTYGLAIPHERRGSHDYIKRINNHWYVQRFVNKQRVYLGAYTDFDVAKKVRDESYALNDSIKEYVDILKSVFYRNSSVLEGLQVKTDVKVIHNEDGSRTAKIEFQPSIEELLGL